MHPPRKKTENPSERLSAESRRREVRGDACPYRIPGKLSPKGCDAENGSRCREVSLSCDFPYLTRGGLYGNVLLSLALSVCEHCVEEQCIGFRPAGIGQHRLSERHIGIGSFGSAGGVARCGFLKWMYSRVTVKVSERPSWRTVSAQLALLCAVRGEGPFCGVPLADF